MVLAVTPLPDSAAPSGTLVDTGVEPRPVVRREAGLELGRVFGRYVVLQLVGAGGAGTVYAAYDPELDRKIALKVLNDDRPRARQRLMREAQAIAKVTHTNIVAVHDVGTHEGRVYIAMEFVDGLTLRRWLQAETRPWAASIAKLRDAGAGLAAAHDAGLVHRDFKPDNVLVDRTGRVVVLDFGLARRAAPTADSPLTAEEAQIESMMRAPRQTPLDINITGAGALMGTPAYMAPEQHLRQRVDARTDQFAFCVVAWEALFGERPYGGNSASEAARAVTRGSIVEPARASAAPAWVRRVLERGLAARASDRHADMRTLLGALGRDPWRIRKRAALAGVVVLGAVATGTALNPGASEESICGTGPERWAGVWDSRRRDRIAQSFVATELPYQAGAFESVAAALDDYVERWNTLHREACEATHVHGLQPRASLELQWGCLGRRRGEVAALTDELIAADAMVVEHAVEAVRELRRLDTCTDVAALVRGPALPEDDRMREQVESLRGRLVDARAKAQAARFDQAIEIVSEIVAQAERAGATATIADAKLQLGAVLEATGRFAESRTTLMEAIWAGEASGHDDAVARAWTRLVWVVGVELLDTDRGALWIEFARAAVTRAGGGPRLRAQLVHNEGGVLYRQRRLDEALARYTEALALQHDALGPEHPQIATTLNHIANTLIELKRFGEAAEYAQRSLSLRERILGPHHPKVAASLNNIGELRRRQGKHAESLAAAQQSLAIVAGRGGPEELVALVLVGEAQQRLRRWRQAAVTYERVLELRERGGGESHASLVPTLRTLASVRVALGEQSQADALEARAERIDALPVRAAD